MTNFTEGVQSVLFYSMLLFDFLNRASCVIEIPIETKWLIDLIPLKTQRENGKRASALRLSSLRLLDQFIFVIRSNNRLIHQHIALHPFQQFESPLKILSFKISFQIGIQSQLKFQVTHIQCHQQNLSPLLSKLLPQQSPLFKIPILRQNGSTTNSRVSSKGCSTQDPFQSLLK